MKYILILFLLFSYSIVAFKEEKSYFFVFSSDFPYQITSGSECVEIQKKYSKGKKIYQKAVYYTVKESKYCMDTDKFIEVSYKNKKVFLNLKKDNYFDLNKIKKSNIFSELYFMMTPSGVFMMEIIDKKVKKDIPVLPPLNIDGSLYKIVFPWLCLEFCSGNANEEVNEVLRNKSVLSGASYERFTMDGGNWRVLGVSDITGDLVENSLSAWPMIRSNSRTMDENEMEDNINAIWNNREALASKMINEANNNNYEGYCLDIEFQTSRDSIRDKYIMLVDFLADRLHQNGKKLMVAHAHWATMAPMNKLKNTSVDYVATMDPYTASDLFFRKNGDETRGQAYEDYNQIEHNRLIWAFAWEYHVKSTQEAMWRWLQDNGYNEGVAGAAVWRVPAENSCKSGCNSATEGINYYEAFDNYYPVGENIPEVCEGIDCSGHGICEERMGEPVCNCYEGFHGNGTECIENIENCTPDIICSNHGVCNDETGIVACDCEAGYVNFGTECLKFVSHKKKIIKTVSSENFKIEGAMPYFHNDNNGFKDFSVWCYSDEKDSENTMRITFYNLEAGNYRIFTFIPAVNKLAKYAKYNIKNGVSLTVKKINQVGNKGNWGYLGEIYADGSLEISLSCNDLESLGGFEKIYFSAVKLELLQED